MNIESDPRSTMLDLLSKSKFPASLKLMGYAFINAASDKDIDNVKVMFLKVLEHIQNKDADGLKAYLVSCGMDGTILNQLVSYATNRDKD